MARTVAPPTVLVLLRHGDAGDALASPERDALRPLSAKGRKQSRRAGKALVHLGLVPRDVFTSRLARAVETADIASLAVGADVRRVPTAALAPDAAPERIVRALLDTPPPTAARREGHARPAGRRASRPGTPAAVVRWLVGHEPHLSRLLGFLTGTPAAAVELAKGGFAVVETDGRGPAEAAAKLRLLVEADALKALRH
ncbi:MAG: histidine phosphatase family protein [Planctomycetia bacterium]|nr:histidine phosphatase family protein [Planctomycetia bacterium]